MAPRRRRPYRIEHVLVTAIAVIVTAASLSIAVVDFTQIGGSAQAYLETNQILALVGTPVGGLLAILGVLISRSDGDEDD